MGKIAFRLAELIGDLDERVFGEKKTAYVVITPGKPKTMSNACAGYNPYGDISFSPNQIIKIGDFYSILVKKFPKSLKGKVRLKYCKDFITRDAYLIGLAAHEVRHRAQHLLPITLISLEDESRAKSRFLQTLIHSNNKIHALFKKGYKKDEYKWEFDALIIERWAAKIWQETKDLSKVARLVKTDANDFRKRGKKQSSPFIFSIFQTWSKPFLFLYFSYFKLYQNRFFSNFIF